ncbi:E3 ubiquitin-protein ligase DTX4 [Larimichthys crocea]|uniref:Uncharacterized protein n=1 Tax=Larimichthys crocea TaxID=215358 RepID=A0ACD3Q5G4_LARCR|nr:E3 ubiquitin-protein ligase DTX4 [Larimichthys crocea]
MDAAPLCAGMHGGAAAGSRMLLASAVVVWEWLNEHGRWRPYSPAVCHHIEAVIRSDPRCGSVVLGQVDSRLSPYIIDLHSMHQFRQDTGTLRPVRRSFYDPTSAPGQGWLWEWENDAGSWTAYDTEVGIAIQAARDRQQPWLDLAPLGFCYLIDFESMTQINGQTQRCRRIQRRSDLAYPLVSGTPAQISPRLGAHVHAQPWRTARCGCVRSRNGDQDEQQRDWKRECVPQWGAPCLGNHFFGTALRLSAVYVGAKRQSRRHVDGTHSRSETSTDQAT